MNSRPTPVENVLIARNILAKLNLNSLENIQLTIDQLPEAYCRTFLKHNINYILSKAVIAGVMHFDYFFLNLNLTTLIMLKLINQLSNNTLGNHSEYDTVLKLASEAVNLKFEILDNVDGTKTILQKTLLSSFYQGNFLSLVFGVPDVNKVADIQLISAGATPTQVEEIARKYLSAHQLLNKLILELNKVLPDLDKDWVSLEPTAMQYALTVCQLGEQLFNLKEIQNFLFKTNKASSDKTEVQAVFLRKIISDLSVINLLLDSLLNHSTISFKCIKILKVMYNIQTTL
jgi:hypothetical protein